jgi:hypothetical protein
MDRSKILQKWRPVIDNIFSDIHYLIPFIEDVVSYQLELKHNVESYDIISYDIISKKLPIFARNIHEYLVQNIPKTYLTDMKQYINPMTGEILYEYNGKFLSIKLLQKQRIEDFLIEIDFNNIIDKLYDNSPKKYIRKIKMNKINDKKYS